MTPSEKRLEKQISLLALQTAILKQKQLEDLTPQAVFILAFKLGYKVGHSIKTVQTEIHQTNDPEDSD